MCGIATEDGELPELPGNAKSVLVIALSHPKTLPELDWFYKSGNTIGNSNLIKITRELSDWIENTFRITTYHMPYYVEKGGIYLKDAAVLAGLGCIGKNNLLVTPRYGPRVRLRALLLEEALMSGGPIKFDPCKDCLEYCRKRCPREAFHGAVHIPGLSDITHPPAGDGYFLRSRCMQQMDSEWEMTGNPEPTVTVYGMDNRNVYQSDSPVKHCRQCEFACPVGQ